MFVKFVFASVSAHTEEPVSTLKWLRLRGRRRSDPMGAECQMLKQLLNDASAVRSFLKTQTSPSVCCRIHPVISSTMFRNRVFHLSSTSRTHPTASVSVTSWSVHGVRQTSGVFTQHSPTPQETSGQEQNGACFLPSAASHCWTLSNVCV